jgi:NAD-reducing hydrogenase large subunit
MRKFGQEIIRATAGKKIHGTGAIPGGINKNLSSAERGEFLPQIDAMIAWSSEALELFKKLFRENQRYFMDFASFESNFVSLVRADGGLDLYDGLLRAKDPEGQIIFDKVQPRDYLSVIREEVRPWSYMKFPFIRPLGKEKGWYRVGPLARLNNCDFIDTTFAEAERKDFLKLGKGRPVHATLAYHWARLIETLHAAEKIKELLSDPDLQGTDLLITGTRRSEGMAWIEAPRGTLFHHYRVRDDDTIEMANLIVSTTSNNEPMNRAVQKVAQEELSGKEITEGLLNKVEIAIRAFDPCLSCATHALGRMALEVTLVDSRGGVVDRKLREQA